MAADLSATHYATSSANRSSVGGQRETFAADELAIVLSHYDVGVIDSVTEFPRGSRKAPKLLIVSEQGKFLLKRRARGKDDPFKVAFTHSLQLFLAAKQFPLPHLVGTKRHNNSMLQWRNGVYEIFEYIPGQSFPQSPEATNDAGRVLAVFHKLLEDFKSEFHPPSGSYHMASAIEHGLKTIAAAMPVGSANENADVHLLLSALLKSYRRAAEQVKQQGIDSWPKTIVHADWHPGNMLFRDNRVVAVIDYDSARLLPRVIDIANGTLQFSIIGGDEDVGKWPDALDETRLASFARGYDQVMLLSQAEIRSIPPLMIEALIAEAVFPIAQTGSIGRVEGLPFLQMVIRKVLWIERNYDRLVELLEE
jgi:Ser/Thr protein kinase RdoA (MazF antagonist)